MNEHTWGLANAHIATIVTFTTVVKMVGVTIAVDISPSGATCETILHSWSDTQGVCGAPTVVATKPRLGEKSLHAASKAKFWVNIDHHVSNPAYGDLNIIDATSPATGQILYHLIRSLDMPLPDETRDAVYVAVSTDTGSFQYGSTTAATYDLGADLIRRGLDVGKINADTYDNHPFRRLELMRELLNTLEISADGKIANWELRDAVRLKLDLQPDDSEGLIDLIRAVKGVKAAVFFEELEGGKIRVSMRSKDKSVNVCEVAMKFGGGGHALAAGIRMGGPWEDAKVAVLAALGEALGK